MVNQEVKYSLKEIVEILISDDAGMDLKKSVIDQVYVAFFEQARIGDLAQNVAGHQAVSLNSGKAIGVMHAAECLKDYHRTIQLLKGLHKSVLNTMAEKPNKKVHVFYAGTGPFAPFVHFLGQLFTAGQICFTLLEVNPESLNCTKELISNLQMTSYVSEFLLADATTYVIKNPENVDVLFSETLDSMLFREAYVPILMNLKPQLAADVKIIPQNVKLSIMAFKEIVDGVQRKYLGSVFNVFEFLKDPSKMIVKEEYVQCAKIPVSKDYEGYKFAIQTEVQVYKDCSIEFDQSSITLSFVLEKKVPFDFNTFNFTYDLYPNLELKCDFENQ